MDALQSVRGEQSNEAKNSTNACHKKYIIRYYNYLLATGERGGSSKMAVKFVGPGQRVSDYVEIALPIAGAVFETCAWISDKIGTRFHSWLQLRLVNDVKRIYLEDGVEDPVLQGYRCPISGQVPICPVEAPDGRFYERGALEELADKAGIITAGCVRGKVEGETYPLRTFNVDQLRDGHMLSYAIQVRFRYLVEQDMVCHDAKEAQEALKKYQDIIDDSVYTSKTGYLAALAEEFVQQSDILIPALSLMVDIEKNGGMQAQPLASLLWSTAQQDKTDENAA